MKITDNKWIVSAILALLLVAGTVVGQTNIVMANDTEMSACDDEGYADEGMDNYDDQSDSDESMQEEDGEESSSNE